MTTEILRNLVATESLGLTASLSMDDVDAVVFAEGHYINNRKRGKVWEETMILLPRSINMVMLSVTLDHPEYLAHWLGLLKKKPIHLIQNPLSNCAADALRPAKRETDSSHGCLRNLS